MKLQRFLLILLYVGIIRAQNQSSSTLGIEWSQIEGNPLLVAGACLSWRCAGVTDPTLVQDTSGNISLWFTTVGIQQTGSTAVASNGPYIGRATSENNPLSVATFSPENTVVPVDSRAAWDRYVETPTVRYNADSSLTMWYLGYSAPGFVAPAIGQMTSTNLQGTSWNRPATPIYRPTRGAWDGDLVTGPTVVHGPDGVWRLYYTGLGTKNGIGLLTSQDGNHWTPYANNPILQAEPGAWDDQILEQAVTYANGQYWLWYSGFSGPLQSSTSISIGLATSSDGVHWTRYAGNPVIRPGPAGSWNDLRVLAPDVIVEPDGSLLMVAYGQSQADIGHTAGSIGFWRSH
jgi:hypothetical protein